MKITKTENTVTQHFRDTVEDIFDWCKAPFEFGHGWNLLVAHMLDELESKTKEQGLTTEYIQIVDIEDRYGALQVAGIWPAELDQIIERYAVESTKVCRACGKPGRLMVGAGVIWHTACDEHALPNSVTCDEHW